MDLINYIITLTREEHSIDVGVDIRGEYFYRVDGGPSRFGFIPPNTTVFRMGYNGSDAIQLTPIQADALNKAAEQARFEYPSKKSILAAEAYRKASAGEDNFVLSIDYCDVELGGLTINVWKYYPTGDYYYQYCHFEPIQLRELNLKDLPGKFIINGYGPHRLHPITAKQADEYIAENARRKAIREGKTCAE